MRLFVTGSYYKFLKLFCMQYLVLNSIKLKTKCVTNNPNGTAAEIAVYNTFMS